MSNERSVSRRYRVTVVGPDGRRADHTVQTRGTRDKAVATAVVHHVRRSGTDVVIADVEVEDLGDTPRDERGVEVLIGSDISDRMEH